MKKFIATIGLALITIVSYAQECSYYHKKSCSDKEADHMTYDSQSKSAILGKGQISEFHMVAYKNLDYRISVCSEPVLGDQIQFRIYEKKRVLVKPKEEEAVEETGKADDSYDENYSEDSYSDDGYSDDSYSDATPTKSKEPQHKIVKELLYDNKDDGFNNKLEFTAEGAMSLIIEVIVPGSGSTSKLKIRETGCVGVLIEHRKAKRVGF